MAAQAAIHANRRNRYAESNVPETEIHRKQARELTLAWMAA
jgi:hypothetical protein